MEGLSIRELLAAGVGYVADVLARIVSGLGRIAPIALGLAGCEGPRVEHKAPAPAVNVQPKVVEKSSEEPKAIGKFDITFYYVVGEDEVLSKRAVRKKPANTNETELTAVAANDQITIYEPTRCAPISDVTPEFASQIELQGTGKLRDGRVLNIWGGCSCPRKPCFKVTENQWGTSGSGKPLQPFRTVAVDRRLIKLGSLLYVPLLEGRTMPGRSPWGGYVHDGCVVADDTGGGIDGHQLDLFVGRKGWFLGLSGSAGTHAWARHVPVYDGSKICERKGRHVGRKAASI